MHMYVAILLGNQPQKHTIKKEGNSAVPVSGCMGNFMSVSDQLNNVQPTTNIINEIFPNGQIIRSTMEGEIGLTYVIKYSKTGTHFTKYKTFTSIHWSII